MSAEGGAHLEDAARPLHPVTRPARVPGDWMLHPLALGAACVLALNDRVWKQAYGNWWTGKLSDVAGLLFFPWLLLAAWELGSWLLRRPWRAGYRALRCCIAVTLVGFTAINVSHELGARYEDLLRELWAVLRKVLPASLWLGKPRHTVDPTDLLALVALLVPWRLGVAKLRADGHLAVLAESRADATAAGCQSLRHLASTPGAARRSGAPASRGVQATSRAR